MWVKTWLGIFLSVSALCAGVGRAQSVAPTTPDLALVGGTVYTGPAETPLKDATVVIKDGNITAVGPRTSTIVPKGSSTVDCKELVIVAGFWNSHVHFMERKWSDAATMSSADLEAQLQGMLTRFGFTSVWDTGSPWSTTRIVRDRIERGEVRESARPQAGMIHRFAVYPKSGNATIGIDVESQMGDAAALGDGEWILCVASERGPGKDFGPLDPVAGRQRPGVGRALGFTALEGALLGVIPLEVAGVHDHTV